MNLSLLWCIVAYFVCVRGITITSRLIVKFIAGMQQIEQMEYLEAQIACSDYDWEYIFRSQFSHMQITDFALVETPNARNVSICFGGLELISSVHFDEACHINKRKLMNSNPQLGTINFTHSSYVFPSTLSEMLNKQGFKGQGVKVAVFDTGLSNNHPHFSEYERYDWTNEGSQNDYLGHGTFVAGVIAGRPEGNPCSGIAPDVELHIFRIFTKSQKAYTSWFLDAFNMAIFLGIDVLNLSIGGPDHFDEPFTSKIDEMAANGIIIVSAIGNDGPLWGSANNPADQSSVIGVGGWQSGNLVSKHSSRGMTTWEFPYGIGRAKPDLLSPSFKVVSSSHDLHLGPCRSLSGTSVANPIVTGAIALLLSAADSTRSRKHLSNVAAMKQILMSSADPLVGDDLNPTPSIFEQGAGLLNIDKAYERVKEHVPHVSMWPSRVSNHPEDCPYLWPFCSQQLFASSGPLLANITILNSVSLVGHILRIRWSEKSAEFGEAVDEVTLPPITDGAEHGGDSFAHHRVTLRGAVLTVRADTNRIIWPWVGYLAVAITVNPSIKNFQGCVEGTLSILVGDGEGVAVHGMHEASLDIRVAVTSPPPRQQRVLWDVFHSLSYPSPYVPNDNIADTRTLLDLLGDHPYTNYRDAYLQLHSMGYVVEILRGPWTCFDATHYGTLIIADVEEAIALEEINKLERDVREIGLSLLVVADWYDEVSLMKSTFFDDNTHSQWFPVTGGCNIPALNRLLGRFGMQMGLQVFTGSVDISPIIKIDFLYGNTISSWPQGGHLLRSQTGELSPANGGGLRGQFGTTQAIMGLYDLRQVEGNDMSGRIAVFGDSSFIDMISAPDGKDLAIAAKKELLEMLLEFLTRGSTSKQSGVVEVKNGVFMDARLMHAVSATEVVDVYALQKEEKLRYADHLRYSKIGLDTDTAIIQDICDQLL